MERSAVRTALRGGPRTPASKRTFDSSVHDDAKETAKWEKITYAGIVTCTALAIYNLSRGHPHYTHNLSLSLIRVAAAAVLLHGDPMLSRSDGVNRRRVNHQTTVLSRRRSPLSMPTPARPTTLDLCNTLEERKTHLKQSEFIPPNSESPPACDSPTYCSSSVLPRQLLQVQPVYAPTPSSIIISRFSSC